MHKTFIKIFAVLIIPVFLFACKEETAGGVDKDVLNEVLAQSVGASGELDNMLLKAYGLAALGHDMASADPEGAMVKLEDALALARQAGAAKYRNLYKELSAKTADWPKADKDQVSGAIANIDQVSSRVWLIRYIAEGMAKADADRAAEVAGMAASGLSSVTMKYRDMDARALAAYYADKDMGMAEIVADRIMDPRVKAYAFEELSKSAMAAGDGMNSRRLLAKAASVATTIPGMGDEPPAGTYAPSAPESVKDQVRKHEDAKQVAYAARTLAGIAVTMNSLDKSAARKLMDDAISMATSIDENEFSHTRAYALSDIAGKCAVLDSTKAESLLGMLGHGQVEARMSGIVQVAKVKKNVMAANIISDVNVLSKLAEESEDPYEGAAALYAVGKMIAESSPEKAKEIAGDIEFPNIRNDLLIESAMVWAVENIDEAKNIIEEAVPETGGHGGEGAGVYFNVYKYAPAMNLYQKAVAYKGMADGVKDEDAATAMKLYAKAAGYASEAGSGQMEWMLAAEMCKLDHDKFMSYAAKLAPADSKSQTMALMDIASDWSMNDDPYAGIVWDEAVKAAGSAMDDFEAGCLLGKVGAACAAYYPEKSEAAFAMASERYQHIGSE